MRVETEPNGGHKPPSFCGTERLGAPARLPRMPKPSLVRGAAALIRLMLIRRYPSATPSLFVLMGLGPPSRAAPCEMGLSTVGGWTNDSI